MQRANEEACVVLLGNLMLEALRNLQKDNHDMPEIDGCLHEPSGGALISAAMSLMVVFPQQDSCPAMWARLLHPATNVQNNPGASS
jgi:hypothetical protein